MAVTGEGLLELRLARRALKKKLIDSRSLSEALLEQTAKGNAALADVLAKRGLKKEALDALKAELDTSEAEVLDCLDAAYADEPFVHVLPAGRWPSTGATVGSNSVHLQAAHDPRTGRVSVVAAEDNLVKGAAGQAVQNANLMLGFPETMGLSAIGVAP